MSFDNLWDIQADLQNSKVGAVPQLWSHLILFYRERLMTISFVEGRPSSRS
jgi:hypothetical protein